MRLGRVHPAEVQDELARLAGTTASASGLPPGAVRVDGDTIFQSRAFSWPKVASQSLQAPTPLLYEAHRRNIASI